jgi:hypothetical protein
LACQLLITNCLNNFCLKLAGFSYGCGRVDPSSATAFTMTLDEQLSEMDDRITALSAEISALGKPVSQAKRQELVKRYLALCSEWKKFEEHYEAEKLRMN